MFFKKDKLNSLTRKKLDFDDIFMETTGGKHSDIPESNQERLNVSFSKFTFITPLLLIAVFFIAVVGRVSYLQIKGADYYSSLAKRISSRIEWLLPHRGIIYDRYGIQLVHNIPIYDLIFYPSLSQGKLTTKELKNLAQILKTSPKKIEMEIDKNKNAPFVVLKSNLNTQEVFILKAQKEKWPFLKLRTRERRNYLNGDAFAHILGYVGRITEAELKKYGRNNYLADDSIGKDGIELEYEKLLRGKLGAKSIEISSSRKKIRPIFEKMPHNGANIMLTIDAGLQEEIYQVMEKALKKKGLKAGAAVALDPRDGDVLALASLPSFDSNKLSQGTLSRQELNRLLHSKDSPFLNRVIGGTYPPGSTFKPAVALAALQEKIITPRKTFNCHGYLKIRNIYNPKISYIFHDWKAHGITNLKKAIAQSCDVYFYIVGGGYKNFKGLGIERIKSYAEKLKLGEKSGIDLPGEAKGLIPDKTWKEEVKKQKWYIGDTYHAAIGQGDIALTPLQVADLYSFIANNGILYKPHLLLGIEKTPGGTFDKIKPQILAAPHFKEENLQIVKDGLREAVLTGSSQLLKNLPVAAGAKTGTAQFGDGSKAHAWFAAFAPYDHPKIVLVILAEAGGEGSRTSMPIADEILKWYFNREKH